MRKNLTMLAAFILLSVMNVAAALFEASPKPLQQSSKNVVITFNPAEGNVDGLKGVTTDLYAHIGVYTTKSPSTWAHVKTDWGVNTAANTFKRVAANKFELTIGDMRSYFGITDPSETITHICVIARNAAGNIQTGDNIIEVHPDGFAMDFSSNPANTVILKATEITFTASVSQPSDLEILIDGSSVKSVSNSTSISFTRNFSEQGKEHSVKAVAKSGAETIEKQINVLYVGAAAQQNYPGGTPRQGAVRNADGTVTFCLAAPGKSNVVLVGSWDDYKVLSRNSMKYHDYQGYRYFWTTVSGLDNTTAYPYYYLVDGRFKVSDPYAHLVLDHLSDKWLPDDVYPDRPRYPYEKFDDTMLAVYKGNIDDYNWQCRDFAATNPIAVTNPDALFIYELLLRDFTGTSSQADGTLAQAIEKIPYLRGLGVTAIELMPIMEFDGNNSWGYNTNSYMAPDKSYGSPDEYKRFIDVCHQNGIAVILDIVLNHTPGLHPWYQMYDAGTSPFYNVTAPHDYSVYEDIRQEYPLVEQHWIDVLTYWLTAYKVDGFRFDLTKGLGDSNSYGNGTDSYNQSRIDRLTRLYQAMKKVNPNVIHINENLAGTDEERAMGNAGMLQWNNQNGNAGGYAKGDGADLHYFNAAACSRPAGSTVDYAESHDEEWLGAWAKTSANSQIASSLGNRCKRIGSIATQLLMQPGAKMVWQFGEMGFDQMRTEDTRTNPKEVHWEYLNNIERSALVDTYKKLGWLRRKNPELFSRDADITYNSFGSNNSARSIRLRNGAKEVIAFVNPGTSKTKVSCAATSLSASNSVLVTEGRNAKTSLTGSGTVTVELPAHSYAVYSTNAVSAVEQIGIDSDDNRVYSVDGAVVIEGEYNHVSILNLAGQTVFAGRANGRVDLAPGMYIVNVDGKASKVAVR